MRVPWTARRSNQSILKEISPEYSLKGLMLKLKLQYFGHLMQRTDSSERTLMLGKIEGRDRRMTEDEMVGCHQLLSGYLVQFSRSVVSDSATPRTAPRQASLSITNSRSLLKLMSIESVTSSSHVTICRPFSSCPQSLTASESFPMSV